MEDVARANGLSLENEIPSGAYNIGTGVETSVNELYELMCSLSASELPPERRPQLPGEQTRSSVDPSKAAKIMGWRAEVDLSTGLKDTLRSFAAS